MPKRRVISSQSVKVPTSNDPRNRIFLQVSSSISSVNLQSKSSQQQWNNRYESCPWGSHFIESSNSSSNKEINGDEHSRVRYTGDAPAALPKVCLLHLRVILQICRTRKSSFYLTTSFGIHRFHLCPQCWRSIKELKELFVRWEPSYLYYIF